MKTLHKVRDPGGEMPSRLQVLEVSKQGFQNP